MVCNWQQARCSSRGRRFKNGRVALLHRVITRLRDLTEDGYGVQKVNAVIFAGMGGMRYLLDVLSYKTNTLRLRQAGFWWNNRKQSRPNLWCWLVRLYVWAFSRLALIRHGPDHGAGGAA